jgi:hypothetical protein
LVECDRAADAVLWFVDVTSRGARLTLKWCRQAGKPSLAVIPDHTTRPSQVARVLGLYPHVKDVMVRGNRESKAPGIGSRIERSQIDVFAYLGHRAEG